MLQIINVVVSFFGAFEHFFKINQMSFALYMDFLFVFVSICIFVPILVQIGFPFGFLFGFPFLFLFGFPFGFSFCSDNLISLRYSEAGFSANLFGLFSMYFGKHFLYYSYFEWVQNFLWFIADLKFLISWKIKLSSGGRPYNSPKKCQAGNLWNASVTLIEYVILNRPIF